MEEFLQNHFRLPAGIILTNLTFVPAQAINISQPSTEEQNTSADTVVSSPQTSTTSSRMLAEGIRELHIEFSIIKKSFSIRETLFYY